MAEDKRYLNFVDGTNVCWLTGIKVNRDDASGRTKVKLTFAEKPTSEAYDAPFTSHVINCPVAHDSQFAKIMMDRNFKTMLYPFAELEPGAKSKASEVIAKVRDALEKFDFKVELDVKLKEGNTINSKTGEPVVFSEIVGLTAVEAVEKAEYASDIEWDDFDIPF